VLPRFHTRPINVVVYDGSARKFNESYWDGDRKFGYGGYKYIPGRWKNVAKKIIFSRSKI
jgi:hypothetical protein